MYSMCLSRSDSVATSTVPRAHRSRHAVGLQDDTFAMAPRRRLSMPSEWSSFEYHQFESTISVTAIVAINGSPVSDASGSGVMCSVHVHVHVNHVKLHVCTLRAYGFVSAKWFGRSPRVQSRHSPGTRFVALHPSALSRRGGASMLLRKRSSLLCTATIRMSRSVSSQ